jgi:ABC-type cobalamin/Fe3+-siderophores transport system ATPase subunit
MTGALKQPDGSSGNGRLLEVADVSVRFGGIVALDGVSFGVEAGQIAGLIGPNGAGKTTLFNCLSRLYQCGSGDILFDGGSLLQIPLMLAHDASGSQEFSISAPMPEGWKASSGTGKFLLPSEESTALRVEIQTPEALSANSLGKNIEITAVAEDAGIGKFELRLVLAALLVAGCDSGPSGHS